MINQYEVTSYLADELPEMKEELKRISPTPNIFKSIQCLTDYTRGKVVQHDLRILKKCFATAENIYAGGNALVRDAMENIFIYAFPALLNSGSKNEKIELQAIVPLRLHTAYVQQMLQSGI